MASHLDMPTNEGTLALARAVSGGARIAIRNAVLLTVSGDMDVETVAGLDWETLQGESTGDTLDVPCTSMLPSVYHIDGEPDSTKPVTALDMEFTVLPQNEFSYNTIAVLADVYYAFAPFKKGGSYSVGVTVWRNDEDAYTYWKCKKAVTDSDYPANDSEHWESVMVGVELDATSTEDGDLHYYTISDTPVLLYVSKLQSGVSVCEYMEIDYKVRLYLECDRSKIDDYVVFDTIGPEFMGSAGIDLLASFAESLQTIRLMALNQQ